MITITLYQKAITCNGHANFSSKGNDIYCAGVSAVILSAMNWFKKSDIEYEMADGLFKFKLVNQSEDNLYKLDLLKQQLSSFQQSDFKKYIQIKKSRKENYEK